MVKSLSIETGTGLESAGMIVWVCDLSVGGFKSVYDLKSGHLFKGLLATFSCYSSMIQVNTKHVVNFNNQPNVLFLGPDDASRQCPSTAGYLTT